MKNSSLKKLALFIGAMSLGGGAFAATDSGSGSLAVSATVASECAVAQNTAIAFGNLGMLTGAAQSSTDSVHAGAIDAICTNGTPTPGFKYSSANNTTPGADFRLVGADTTTFITYTLHQDGTATLSPVTAATAVAHPNFTATGAAQSLALSAKILAAEKQLKLVQAYTDTITVTTVFGI